MPQCHAGRWGRGRLTALLLVAAAGVTGVAPAAAHAQSPFTLTFNNTVTDVPAGINYVDNCYMEAGVRVMAVGDACGMPASLATYTSADPTGYTGSGALFSTFQPSIDLMPMSGTFSLTSIGLAPFLLGPLDVNPISVLFTGMRVGGNVTQTINLGTGLTGLSMFQLNGFTNLSSVRLTVTAPSFEPYVQIDNVTGTISAVPEPATFALVGLGLASLGVGARRRRRALP